MKKVATFVEHENGFFLMINNDINRREVILDGKTVVYSQDNSKQTMSLKKYMKNCRNTFTGYDYQSEPLIIKENLTDKLNYISVDNIYNPELQDIETGEIIAEVVEIKEEVKPIKQKPMEAPKPPKQVKDEINKRGRFVVNWTKGSITDTVDNDVIHSEIITEYDDEARKEYLKQLSLIHKKRSKEEAEPIVTPTVECPPEDVEAMKAESDKKWEAKCNAEAQAKVEADKQEELNSKQQLNTNTMKTETSNASASNDANKETVNNKNSNKMRGFKRGVAKTTQGVVVATTEPVVMSLIIASDILYEGARLFAGIQATAVKPLGLHPDATRAELKEQIMNRNSSRCAKVYSAPINAKNFVVGKAQQAKERLANRNAQTINAEIVS